MDSAVDEEYNSIAELIELVNQLETQVEQQDTKVEVTESEAFTDLRDDKPTGDSVFRPDLAVNEVAPATIRRNDKKNTFEVTHILPQYIVDRLGGVFTVKRGNRELKNPNLSQLQVNDIVYVGDTSFVFLSGGRLEFKQEDFKSRENLLNLYIRATNTVKWSFLDLYSEVGEGLPAIKTPSQFKNQNLRPDKIYNLKQGDKLTLHIDSTDNWNSTLGDNEQQLKIYLKDKDGNEVSVMKADKTQQGDKIIEGFLSLRKEAYKRWVDAGKPNTMNLGISVGVDGIFLGSPELVIVDGTLQDIKLSEAALDKVVIAKGYILDGEVVIDREIKNVDKTYVAKLSNDNKGKKQPIVIIKRGETNIAFPISLVKKSQPIDFEGIFNSLKSPQEKIIAINEAIIKNGVDTPKLVYADINNEEKIKITKEAFESRKTTVTADTLASKEYKKANLNRDATIKIDLDNIDRVFNSPKVRLDFKTLEYKTDRDIKNENLTDLENSLNNLAVEVYQDFVRNSKTKYVNAKGVILEDTKYSDSFDDNEIVGAQNQLQKIGNINILREAFSEKLPKVVESALGAKKISEIRQSLKQYDFIKSQIAISDITLKSGNKNSKC